VGTCGLCGRKNTKIYVRGLCYLCYQHQQVLTKLEEISASFIALNQYNRQLFELYLSYVKRYQLHYAHLRQTKNLTQILSTQEITIIENWENIDQLCLAYPSLAIDSDKPRHAFRKMAYMLAELGVLPPAEDAQHRETNKLL